LTTVPTGTGKIMSSASAQNLSLDIQFSQFFAL